MKKTLILLIAICTSVTLTAQEYNITGVWEKEGTPMGEDGTGWVMPHKHSAPDCGKDHSVFNADNTGKEVKYNENCETSASDFKWSLEGNVLTFTKGERSVNWHIKSIEDGTMTMGVKPRPNSENLMYVIFKRKE